MYAVFICYSQIITLGKKGDLPAHRRASAFVLEPSLLPKLFTTYAARYATRPGGYTRIHKYGNRPGDNAPHAILELVDNPNDVKFEMAARAVGFEALSHTLEHGSLRGAVNNGIGKQVAEVVSAEKTLHFEKRGLLKSKTRLNMQKVLRFRGAEGEQELIKKAKEHTVRHNSYYALAYVHSLLGSRSCQTSCLPWPSQEVRQYCGSGFR
jgi:large subunit ribosomal protein L17